MSLLGFAAACCVISGTSHAIWSHLGGRWTYDPPETELRCWAVGACITLASLFTCLFAFRPRGGPARSRELRYTWIVLAVTLLASHVTGAWTAPSAAFLGGTYEFTTAQMATYVTSHITLLPVDNPVGWLCLILAVVVGCRFAASAQRKYASDTTTW